MKEFIFRSVHVFLECVRACLNSKFLARIDKVYANLVSWI
jgi:hypothetical protein